MLSRCLFITSSYSSRCLRTEKFCASTCFCARSMARRDHPVLDRHALFHPQPLHQARDAIRPEDAHQVVFERQVEARRARVALAAGAAAQLVVDAPRLVPLGAEDVQARRARSPRRARRRPAAVKWLEDALPVARAAPGRSRRRGRSRRTRSSSTNFSSPLGSRSATSSAMALLARHVLGAAAEQDVGAAAGHVGGDGHGALAAGLGDDLGFLRVVLGVQHDVLDAALAQQGRQPLGLLDRHRADQRRPARLLLLEDVADDRLVLLPLGAVDEVGLLDALQRAVGRDRPPRRGCRSWRTRPPRSRPCRSCPTASCTCGSSSGR